jgi:hypothetical protein
MQMQRRPKDTLVPRQYTFCKWRRLASQVAYIAPTHPNSATKQGKRGWLWLLHGSLGSSSALGLSAAACVVHSTPQCRQLASQEGPAQRKLTEPQKEGPPREAPCGRACHWCSPILRCLHLQPRAVLSETPRPHLPLGVVRRGHAAFPVVGARVVVTRIRYETGCGTPQR